MSWPVGGKSWEVPLRLSGIFEQRDVANLRTDGLHHLLTVWTGEADRRSFADTGGERNGLRPAIHQHLGAGYGTLAGTAAAAHEADDLAFTERFETSLSFGRRDKSVVPGHKSSVC